MKLVYPENGLYELVKSDLEEVRNSLGNAANVYYSVPYDFYEYDELMNLRDQLYSYQRKIDSLLDQASLVSSEYRELDENLKTQAAILDSQIVTKRERSIT